MTSELLMPGPAGETVRSLVKGHAEGRGVCVVNFHATPSYRADEYRRQFETYARAFTPMNEDDLEQVFAGKATGQKPGLIPVLFEGFRDNLDVIIPILEEFGFTGWLFAPSYFLGVPAEQQREFAASHVLYPAEKDEYPGERIALTWDEARDIAARGHVFACHSRTHNELLRDSSEEMLVDEIVTAKAEMEQHLNKPVKTFCWLHGAPMQIHPHADQLMREAGYKYLFSNFKIQKLQ